MARTVDDWPTAEHWLYRWFDDSGRLLYVGITLDQDARRRGHLSKSYWTRWAGRCEFDLAPHIGRHAALRAERAVIQTEGPVFNRDGNPDFVALITDYITSRGEDPEQYFAVAEKPHLRNYVYNPLCPYVGVTELAMRWGVTRQRADQVSRRGDFPPGCQITAGRIFFTDAVAEWEQARIAAGERLPTGRKRAA